MMPSTEQPGIFADFKVFHNVSQRDHGGVKKDVLQHFRSDFVTNLFLNLCFQNFGILVSFSWRRWFLLSFKPRCLRKAPIWRTYFGEQTLMNENNTSCQCNGMLESNEHQPIALASWIPAHQSHYSAGTNHLSSLGLSLPICKGPIIFLKARIPPLPTETSGTMTWQKKYSIKCQIKTFKSQSNPSAKILLSMEASWINPDLCSTPALGSSSWITLDKILNLSELPFLHL